MDSIQSMPAMDLLTTKKYTAQDWLLYYKNIWTKNLVARTVDVQSDVAEKAVNPDKLVASDDGREIPVKERLEHRKILVQDALELIAAIDTLLGYTPEEYTEKALSEKALAVAEDMIPKEKPAEAAAAPEVGQPCTTEDGKPGSWMPGQEGGPLVCTPIAESENKEKEAEPAV